VEVLRQVFMQLFNPIRRKMHMKLDITRFKNIYPFIFVSLFFGLLLLPIVKPGLSLKNIESDFNGHQKLISIYSMLRVGIGDRVFPRALIGSDGWMFYTSEGAISDYQGGHFMRDKQLRELQQSLDAFNDDLKQKGITLIVVIPPNKESVYPQYMPAEIPILEEKSRLDDFMEYMQLHSRTRIIDLRNVLIEKSREQQVYYKQDTHWNSYGAYFSYKEIFSALSEEVPPLRAYSLDDFKIKAGKESSRDIPRILGLSTYQESDWVFKLKPSHSVNVEYITIPVSNRSIKFISNEDKTLPRIVVFHDSFFGALRPFFETHFSEMTLISQGAGKELWSLKWLEHQDTDIVIIELVERYFEGLMGLLSTYDS
jgi:hypothetical protein